MLEALVALHIRPFEAVRGSLFLYSYKGKLFHVAPLYICTNAGAWLHLDRMRSGDGGRHDQETMQTSVLENTMVTPQYLKNHRTE